MRIPFRLHPTYALALLVPIVAGGLSLARPPRPAEDFAMSFAGWDAFMRGGPFNHLPAPETFDLARDHATHLGWWSPGPAALVGVMEQLTRHLRVSVSIWLLLLGLAAVLGCARLFRALGFDAVIAGWSTLIFSVGWHTLYPFRIFHGGELFLVALAPWTAFVLLDTWATRRGAVVWIAALIVVGVWLKLSFLPLALCLLAGAWVVHSGGRIHFDRASLALAGRFAIATISAWFILHGVLLGPGDNPAIAVTPDYGFGHILHSVAMAFVLPLFSVFSLVSLSGNVLDVLRWPHFEESNAILAISVVLAALTYWAIARRVSDKRYCAFAGTVAFGYVLIFAVLFTRNAAISFEDRHFRPAGMLLIPGLVTLACGKTSMLLRLATRGALAAAMLWGIGSYTRYLVQPEPLRHVGSRGLVNLQFPAGSQRLLSAIDARLPANGSVLFAVPAAEIALELPRRRSFFFSMDPTAPQPPAAQFWRGRVDDLIVIIPAAHDAASGTRELAAFGDYERNAWTRLPAGPWTIFHQGKTDLRGLAAPAPLD